MNFVIIGSGAVGSYFGARLLQAGHDVTFIARGATLTALREHGLRLIDDVSGEDVVLTVHATDDLTQLDPPDYVLIAVKTWQVAPILPQLPALKGEHTRFLTLQNGVEAPHEVAAVVGVEQTLGGLVRGFFELDAPGVVRHVGVQPTINFGQLDGSQPPEALRLAECLVGAGAASECSADVTAALWEKFLLVTALSGVGAVTRSPIGEIRACDATWQMLTGVMSEIAAVARARGVNIRPNAVEHYTSFVSGFPPEATTSMQRDLMSGLPSELDAQTGAVVRLGREAGVPTPINAFIYASLILQEDRARAPKP